MAFLAPLVAPLLEGGAVAAGGAAAAEGGAVAGGAVAGGSGLARAAGQGMLTHFTSGHGESRGESTTAAGPVAAAETNPVFN